MSATAVDTKLAQRAADHMTQSFTDGTETGGWTVARDHRDGTAAVVWRPGDEPATPQTRGMILYRWLCSLRNAGFEAQARTDMGVFGRPEQESPDRVARWLHVTAWAVPDTTPVEPLAPLPSRPPVVTMPVPAGRRLVCSLSGIPVTEIQFTYRPAGVEIVLHYESGDLDWAQLETEPPLWLADLAEQHRPTAGGA